MFRVVCGSVASTLALAEVIGAHLKHGDVVLLRGDLGAGKTTFTQGICKGAGMQAGVWARSPTFSLVNEYKGKIKIRHADLYRIDSEEDYSTIGLFDSAFDGITIIEWAQKLPLKEQMSPTLAVDMVEMSETARELTLDCSQAFGESITSYITK